MTRLNAQLATDSLSTHNVSDTSISESEALNGKQLQVLALVETLLDTLTQDNLMITSTEVITLVDSIDHDEAPSVLTKTASMIVARALDSEPPWSAIYAKLSRTLADEISCAVPACSHSSTTGEAAFSAGGGIFFHNQLVKLVEDEFSLAMGLVTDRDSNDDSASWTSQVASRHKKGVACFVGHLFVERLVSKWLVHEFIEKLSGCAEELECLCALLSVAAESLHTQHSYGPAIEQYFLRMERLSGKYSDNSEVVVEMLVS